MKMKLGISERINLMDIFPQEGSFVTLKVIRDTLDVLGFKDAEHKEFEIKQADKKITWNAEKEKEEKEFEFGEKATDMIVEVLEELNKEKKLKQQHFSLFEKFVKKEESK